jgi:hypothetical protein
MEAKKIAKKMKERYMPTPEEIEEECVLIRSEWPPERWARQVGATPWKIPVSIQSGILENVHKG